MSDTVPEMTPVDPPPPRRTAFEWSLAALRPADGGVGRPSFMFEAGRASRERAVRFWRWAAVGMTVALVGTVVGLGWLLNDAQRQLAVAETRTRGQGTGDRGQEAKVPEVPRRSGEPMEPRPEGSGSAEESHPLPPVAVPVVERVDPREIAAALRLRRDILTAGLGLIPDGKPVAPVAPPSSGEWDRHWGLPSGVLTTPPTTPRKPAPITPDDAEK
jgi:hypothetical protein